MRSLMSYYYLGTISGHKKRRVGLTAEKPWAGNLLVMHKLQSNTLEDVSHKPVSSSDDCLSEISDGASDDWAPSLKKSGIPEEASTSTSERRGNPLGSAPGPPLDVEKSNIPSTSFFSSSRSSKLSSGQSFKRPFQAMNDGSMDEDERTELWGLGKPRTKKIYGQGRGIDSIRGFQSGTQEQKSEKTKDSSRAGRSKPKAQGKGGVFRQCKPGGNPGRAKLIYDFFLRNRRRFKHWRTEKGRFCSSSDCGISAREKGFSKTSEGDKWI